MCNVVVVRPGSTLFDEEHRIKGSLDIPLSPVGIEQVHRIASDLSRLPISAVYCGPCESAQKTAREIAEMTNAKFKVCDCFRNLDHGLWQGKLIDELKKQQPKLFKQVQENPRAFSPPGGESVAEAETRIEKMLNKLCKKHSGETIAVVIPEPLASLVSHRLRATDLDDMWESECDNGTWEVVDSITKCSSVSSATLTTSRIDGPVSPETSRANSGGVNNPPHSQFA